MIEFVRYVRFGDGSVDAEFRQKFETNRESPMRLDRESLAVRIANLERGGFDCSVEKSALAGFPES